ncbi:MAG: right-handed parallel beta-helix repeat-containing protein, partial [Planctomycetota bacterium]
MKRKNEENTSFGVIVPALAVLLVFAFNAVGGNLEPAGPPGPTMKTLDEVEPRIPISSLPHTISNPGSYYVTGNLISVASGIIVEANDVTIDLMGYSIKGSGGLSAGVYVTGEARKNIEIRNGAVQNFFGGIIAFSSTGPSVYTYRNFRIINVTASENVSGINLEADVCLIKDCVVIDCNDWAIRCGHVSVITGNNVLKNAHSGIVAEFGCTVKDNTVASNGMKGISVSTGCMVTGNKVSDCNEEGIFAGSDCIIADNIVNSNRNGGIKVDKGIVTGNTLRGNAGDDIDIDSSCKVTNNQCTGNGGDSGIHVRGSGNRIEGNNVINSGIGIDVDAGYNFIIKNSASGNTTNYDIAANNSYGPIVNVLGV